MRSPAGARALGIVSLVAGLGALSSQDVVFKLMSGRYSAFEILFLRSCFTLLVLRFAFLVLRYPDPLRTDRLGAQYLRGGLLCTALTCYYLALSVMPLLDVVAIFFTAPLIATALSPWLLKERVSRGQWAAVAAGFLGALVMLGPGAGALQAGAAFAFCSALFYALSNVATRSLGMTDRAATTAYYSVFMYLAVSSLGVVAVELAGAELSAGEVVISRAWRDPDWFDLGLLAGSGVAVAIGFFCLAQAYRLAPIPALAPFEYTALLWAGILGYLFWQDLPTWLSLLGAATIAGSGWYVAVSPARAERHGS